MTPDEICLAATEAGVIGVDAENGTAFRLRRARSPIPLGTSNAKGYIVCTIHYGGHRQQVKLHRLVWIAANGPIPDGLVIDHINGIKNDNRIGNLRLADAELNSRNRRSYKGQGNPASKITPAVAEAIREDHASSHSYAKTAARYGVSKSLVAQIVRGELWRTPCQ